MAPFMWESRAYWRNLIENLLKENKSTIGACPSHSKAYLDVVYVAFWSEI